MAGKGFKLRAGISQPPSACMLATPCPSPVELRVTVTRIESAQDTHSGLLFNPSLTSLPRHLQSPKQPWPVRVIATEQGVWLGGPVHLLQACLLLLPLLHRGRPFTQQVSIFIALIIPQGSSFSSHYCWQGHPEASLPRRQGGRLHTQLFSRRG